MPLEAWMRIGQPLERVVDDFARIFDAWEAGGVKGLLAGPAPDCGGVVRDLAPVRRGVG